MFLKNIYDYFFYKLYKFFEAAPSKWWSDWKAGGAMLVLEILTFISILNYYTVITKANFSDDFLFKVAMIIVACLVVVKYFAILHKDRWKSVVEKFDGYRRNQNILGTWIVLMVILLLIANVVFSFYLMSQIDWKKYN